MKSLISINYKFMSLSPRDLVQLIVKSKYTKGVEACIDASIEDELKYLDNLVFELNKNHLLLQVHGNIELDFERQVEYMKLVENYADFLGYPIVVTFHTVCDEDVANSLSKTVDYLSRLMDRVDRKKMIFCLENLNDDRVSNRLDKKDIRETVLNDESLYFTYDIGHDLADHGMITDLDEYMIEDIRNVHIHSNNNQGVNHMPIYKNDVHWNEIMKGIEFLIVHKYNYNIVYEYGLEHCYKDTVEEKVSDYLKSMDYVSERYSRD